MPAGPFKVFALNKDFRTQSTLMIDISRLQREATERDRVRTTLGCMVLPWPFPLVVVLVSVMCGSFVVNDRIESFDVALAVV